MIAVFLGHAQRTHSGVGEDDEEKAKRNHRDDAGPLFKDQSTKHNTG